MKTTHIYFCAYLSIHWVRLIWNRVHRLNHGVAGDPMNPNFSRILMSERRVCDSITILLHGRRKLFITGHAKLNPEDYSIKSVGGRLLYNCWYLFSYQLYYKCYKSNRSKITQSLCLLLTFHITEYLVCITRGQLIILHLLICFFYPL